MADRNIIARMEAERVETGEGYLHQVCPTMSTFLLGKNLPFEIASVIMEFTSRFYVDYEALLMSSSIRSSRPRRVRSDIAGRCPWCMHLANHRFQRAGLGEADWRSQGWAIDFDQRRRERFDRENERIERLAREGNSYALLLQARERERERERREERERDIEIERVSQAHARWRERERVRERERREERERERESSRERERERRERERRDGGTEGEREREREFQQRENRRRSRNRNRSRRRY